MKRALLLLLLIAGPVRGDAPFALLGGRVRSSGKAAAGVTVTIRSDALLLPRRTATGHNGRYWVAALPPGEYEVTFAREGLRTVTRHVRLHAAEQARVDADLAESTEGESVTLTAATRSVFERPERAWSLPHNAFELLPHARTADALAEYAPSSTGDHPVTAPLIDMLADAEAARFAVPDALLEASLHDGAIVLVTRPAAERPFASLRATFDQPAGNVHGEASAEGSLFSRLSLFAAAAAGDERTFYGKANVAPAASHATTISWLSRAGGNRFAVDHTAALTPGITLFGSHSEAGVRRSSGRLFVAAGAHEISAGGVRTDGTDSFFIDDRWIVTDRWAVNGSLRLDDGDVAPRLALIRHFGRDRYIAQWSDSEWMLAYGRQLTGDGYARAALLREGDETRLVIDAMHDYLFLTFGGNATFGGGLRHANGWVVVVPPFIDRRILGAVAAHYRNGIVRTDGALTWAFAFGRTEPFLKLEIENAFDTPRAWRAGIGVRFE